MMTDTINAFIVYARKDKEIKQRLIAHLNPFVKAYDLILWHDEHLEAGQEWKSHIESRLEKTDLFLLLISVDFMNSEFINEVEFKSAIDRHNARKSVVIPVIINYCQWDIDINLKALQVLPPNANPVAEWTTPDKAFNEIAAGVRKVIESIKAERSANEKPTEEANEKIFTKVEIEAGFHGGEDAWRNYLRKNMNPNVPANLGADAGKYTVIVKFVVNEDGNLSDINCENNPGYGISEEVIRVIKKSPAWIPAIQNGRNVKAYRRQPVTFTIED